MPCDVGRKWLSSISKLVNPKQSQSNTDFIARELGIEKSSLLTSCIRDTASNTTRQVIKLLYSPVELENGRGTDVSDQQRKLIRGKRPVQCRMTGGQVPEKGESLSATGCQAQARARRMTSIDEYFK